MNSNCLQLLWVNANAPDRGGRKMPEPLLLLLPTVLPLGHVVGGNFNIHIGHAPAISLKQINRESSDFDNVTIQWRRHTIIAKEKEIGLAGNSILKQTPS